MDMQSAKFHDKVRGAYHTMAKKHSGRTVVIDASRPVETIHDEIVDSVLKYINTM